MKIEQNKRNCFLDNQDRSKDFYLIQRDRIKDYYSKNFDNIIARQKVFFEEKI